MTTALHSKNFSVVINSFGAEVQSVKDNNSIEYIWQGNKAVWGRQAPVLFPIVGKLRDNSFVFENQNYELPQHGFARDMEFIQISKNIDSCSFRLASNNQTKKKYPFDFIFEIKYVLTVNTLTTFYTIKNPSKKPIHFSVGAHPGFNCPLLPNETFEDYYLEFETTDFKLTALDNGLRKVLKNKLKLQNNRLPLSDSLFNNDALVFENNQINSISLLSNKSDRKITLNCKNWPFFGIWSKKGNNQFICLEPWFGIADSIDTNQLITTKKGIINLNPLSEFNCSYSVSFF